MTYTVFTKHTAKIQDVVPWTILRIQDEKSILVIFNRFNVLKVVTF